MKHTINHKGRNPIYKQITENFIKDIKRGFLKKDSQLPSINQYSESNGVGRDTIEKAYKELRRQGYITSVPAKGYFVNDRVDNKLNIFLIFNKISSCKEIVYESLISALGDRARVDLQIHHYNISLLSEILDNNLDKYQYYVIMPHFSRCTKESEILKIIKKVPESELVLLDKNLPQLGANHISVFQDFENDIYQALCTANDLLKKYKKVSIIFPGRSNHPVEVIEGTCKYCLESSKIFSVSESVNDEQLSAGTVYLVITEPDLACLLKKVRKSKFTVGKDIGIISFNETDFNELLDITVITTDFVKMGQTTAELILNKEYKQVPNPFSVIRRGSL